MTFTGIIFSDSDEIFSDSDELGALVDGIVSMKLRVTLPNPFGLTGQSCTKCLIPQSAQCITNGGTVDVFGFSSLRSGQSLLE